MMMSPRRQASAGRLHGAIIPALIALLMIGLLVWKLIRESHAHTQPADATAAQWLASSGMAAASVPSSAAPESPAQARRRLLTAQWQAARQRLDSYRDATRYPPESQPIAAHTDQLRPFDPIVEHRPALSAQGTPIAGRHLLSSQTQVCLSGQESVVFTMALQDEQGHAAPLRIVRATVHEVQDSSHPQTVAQTALPFEDRGANGDTAANDGTYSARLQPASQGFGATQGTLRVDVDYQSDQGGLAHAFFDVIYMPNVPANWTGAVRETMNQGSLDIHLQAQVREAGRYIVSARAYDAKGKAFGLLTFNGELPTGTADIKLTLFGKLVADAKPAFPIALRDVEAYLLYENRFPDRAMMPRRADVAYTSAVHSISEFSATEWTSEVRQRYLTEYGKDASQALQALQQAPSP